MNASEFTRALAEKMDKEPANIAVFDRELAKAGERAVARGRHAPDITRREAVMLLLAYLSGRRVADAAQAARELAAFTLTEGQNDNALTAFHIVFGQENDFAHLIQKPLVDLLVLLCGRMAEGKVGEDNYVFLAVKDGAVVELQAELNWRPEDRSQKLGITAEIGFNGAVSIPTGGRGYYYATRTATGPLLKWIGEVTQNEDVA